MSASSNVVRTVVAATSVTMIAALSVSAFAAGTTRHAIYGHFADPGPARGFTGVSPAPPGVPQDAVFHGTSTVTGTSMHGGVKYTMWGHFSTTGAFVWHTHELFTGTVAGCGTGTMSYDVDGTVSPYKSPRPRTPLAQHLVGTWTINRGSGTAGLARVVSGGGKLDGTATGTTKNSGTITGTVTCSS